MTWHWLPGEIWTEYKPPVMKFSVFIRWLEIISKQLGNCEIGQYRGVLEDVLPDITTVKAILGK